MGINAITIGIWAAFNPPTAAPYDPSMGDPYWNYVVCLINGDTVTDVSPSALALTNTNATVNTANAKFGAGALYFNGNSNVVSATVQALNLSAGDFTIEAHVSPISLTGDPYLIELYSSDNVRLAIQCNAAGYVQLWGSYGGTYSSITSTGVMTLGVYHHIAITRSGSTWYMFLNGAVIYSGAFLSSLSNVAYRLELGAAAFNGSNYFTGYMDDLRITKGIARYTSAFTPPVKELPIIIGYFTSPVTRGLILDLDIDYDNSAQVFDRSSANRIGVNSGTTFVATPTGKKALVCSGSSLISFPDETAFRPSVFSVSFWIKTTTTSNVVIFEKDSNTGLSIQVSEYNNAVTGMTAGRIIMCNGGYAQILYGTTVINNGSYHHVVVIGNGASDKVYIDGVDVTNSSTQGEPVYSTGPLYIGSRNGTYGFPGNLAHVRMFNVALTAAEVLTLFSEKP